MADVLLAGGWLVCTVRIGRAARKRSHETVMRRPGLERAPFRLRCAGDRGTADRYGVVAHTALAVTVSAATWSLR